MATWTKKPNPTAKAWTPSEDLFVIWDPVGGAETVARVDIQGSSGNLLDVDSNGAARVSLYGSNAKETLIFQRSGSLGAGVEEVIADLPNVECVLESLTLGTNTGGNVHLLVQTYKGDGTLNGYLRIAYSDGTQTGNVFPNLLQNESNGENDFFRNAKYDSTNNKYVIAMKRSARFNNGVRITVKNIGSSAYTAAVNAMVAIYKKG